MVATLQTLSAREDRPLNDWRFHQGEVAEAMSLVATNSDWQPVSLPHCWGWQEAQVTSNYYRGPGWYQCLLNLSPEKGKRCFLHFEAASTVADVFLNGRKLGEHRGGCGAFCFEITTNLSISTTNLLSVRVSNAPEPDIAPLSGDFCVFGGLYRPAHLLVTEGICFTPLDHASSGVFWQQTHVSKNEATIDFTAEISNGTESAAPRVLVARILDADGKIIDMETQRIEIPSRVTPLFHLPLTLKHPHLWNGRADPYLYRAVAELQTTNSEVCDSVEQPLGLRFYNVDPDKGFFLNGKPYRLRGVRRHQDVWNIGWALSIYKQHRTEIAAVITDMAMPVMDGSAAIVALRAINPEVRIVGASGLDTENGKAKAMEAGVRHFIPKPYATEALLQTLHDVLQT